MDPTYLYYLVFLSEECYTVNMFFIPQSLMYPVEDCEGGVCAYVKDSEILINSQRYQGETPKLLYLTCPNLRLQKLDIDVRLGEETERC